MLVSDLPERNSLCGPNETSWIFSFTILNIDPLESYFVSLLSFILISSKFHIDKFEFSFDKIKFLKSKNDCLLNYVYWIIICITSRDIHNQASKVIRPSSQFVKHCKTARWRFILSEPDESCDRTFSCQVEGCKCMHSILIWHETLIYGKYSWSFR